MSESDETNFIDVTVPNSDSQKAESGIFFKNVSACSNLCMLFYWWYLIFYCRVVLILTIMSSSVTFISFTLFLFWNRGKIRLCFLKYCKKRFKNSNETITLYETPCRTRDTRA